MGNRRKLIICLLLSLWILLIPATAAAADWNLNITMTREKDGSLCGELWYNNDMLWRLRILADDAMPVSGGQETRATTVAPDIVHGLFLLKIHQI